MLFDELLCNVNGFEIVRPQEDSITRLQATHQESKIIIVASMSIFNGLMDRRLVSLGLGNLSLFVHVGSSDELHSQVEAKFL